jgi:hypothetical protein
MLSALVQLSLSVDGARRTVGENISVCRCWRKLAADTIICLAQSYNAQDETAALAVVLLDRFLASKIHEHNTQAVQNSEYIQMVDSNEPPRLIASACFVLAMKMKNPVSPCISDVLRIVGLNPNITHFQRCELDILEDIDWEVNSTTGELF